MKALLKKLLTPLMGNVKYQKLFEFLHQLSLYGMHIGRGGSKDDSGEGVAIKYVADKLKNEPKVTVFDIGANVGTYSILLNEVLKDKASICSFEPSQKTFQALQANTKHIANIQAYNFGMGSEDATLTLFSNKDESGLASVYHRKLDHLIIDMNKTEAIEIRTVDGFCQKNNIDHIHFLKIDVEGHEMKVLEGARQLIAAKQIDFIQFEFGGCNIDSRTYFQDFFYLLKDNYNLYRIVRNGLFPVKEYKESHEAFLTTNYLAEKK